MGTGWTRRRFLMASLGAGGLFATGLALFDWLKGRSIRAEVFIAKIPDYNKDIAGAIRSGLSALGVRTEEIKGKRVLLKPNLVETHPGHPQINTNPLVVHGAIETFKSLGAREVLVAEGPGHCRDSFLLLRESGLSEVLVEDRIRFVDLNYDDIFTVPNRSGWSHLKELVLPKTLKEVDWVVSMPKMKTHHWAGVTLAMKNMFGVMPGSYYGWPKNVLHVAHIHQAILDVNSTVMPNLAIVDGIVGMEGDGPIMGDARQAGALVIGRDFPAVDATCARIMTLNPWKIPYLAHADSRIGTIREKNITQRGETIKSVQTRFALVDKIPAQRDLRL